jgi:hypothetical protein
LRKRGLAQVIENDAMLLGTLLEPVVLELYRRRHPDWTVIAPNVSMRSPHHPLAIATPDGFVCESNEEPMVNVDPESKERIRVRADRLVQIKTTAALSADWGPEGTDEIPVDYFAQVQWEMAVAGVPRCDLAVLVAGRTLRIYHVEFVEDVFKQIYRANEMFWLRHVASQHPPDVDGTDAGRALLSMLFPRENKKEELEATPAIDEIGHALIKLKSIERAAAAERAMFEQKLQYLMGSAEVVRGRGWKATWKTRAGAPQWKQIATAAIEAASLATKLLGEGRDVEAAEVLAAAPGLTNKFKSNDMRVFRAAADNEEEQ